PVQDILAAAFSTDGIDTCRPPSPCSTMAYRSSADSLDGYSGSYNPRQAGAPAYDKYSDDDDDSSVTDSHYTTSTHTSMVSSTNLTAPTHGPNHPTWIEQFSQVPQGDLDPDAHTLWCEFCGSLECPEEFNIGEEDFWIDHHLRHMNHHLPSKLVCWFCNDYEFTVDERASREKRQENFLNRMWHIREHIFDNPRLTWQSMRPDFYMARHLHSLHVISDEVYRDIVSYTEVPPSMRIPGTPGSVSYNRNQHGQGRSQRQDDSWYQSPQQLVRGERRRNRPERPRR
ncbi:hypothetical protein B0T20DRAFT_357224, partial [Sordaria brevicollis]